MTIPRLDQSTGARARRRAKHEAILKAQQRAVTMPAGLTIALALFLLCAFAAAAVMTKAGGLW